MRPLFAIGSALAVFMCAVLMIAVVTFALIVMPGSNVAHRGNVATVDKILAIAGKGVGDRNQCPDDDKNQG